MNYKDNLLSNLNAAAEEAEEEIKSKHSFYLPKLDKDGKLQGITINRVKLLEILMQNGFYRYDLSVERYCFVQITNKKVKQVSGTYIMDWWFNYLKELPDYSWQSNRRDYDEDPKLISVKKDYIQNKFLMSIGSYFSENLLSRLIPDFEIRFNSDTKKEKFVYYRNGFVVINKQGYQFIPDYTKLKDFVWESQILSRNYNPQQSSHYQKSEFYRFCFNISDSKPFRLLALQTIIGYLLHDYNKYKMKATILTDTQIGVEGEANGRTGKGIFANGLGAMLNNRENKEAKVYCQINGKGFDVNDKHRYSKAALNTALIHLEDVKAYFLIDHLFNDITENITVDIKNEKPFIIHPKLLISTNKTIKIKGESAEDRTIQFEFSEHYSKQFSPEDEFGHWLFEDWSHQEWELFDAFMIESIWQFFKNDTQVIIAESINLNRRALIEHTSPEFINYMDYYRFTDKDHEEERQLGYYIVPPDRTSEEYSKKELYHDFLENYPDMVKRRRFSQAKFTGWLRAYSEASELLEKINPEKDERRSNNIDYITFRRKK